MAFKPKQKKSNNGPSVDWGKVNEQLPDDGSVDARVALVIDLGEHHQGLSVNGKGVTYVATEGEAWDLVDQAGEIVGENTVEGEGYDQVEEVGEVWILPFKIVKDKWVFPQEEGQEDNVSYAFSEKEAEELVSKAKSLDKYGSLGDVEGNHIENAYNYTMRSFKSKQI